MTGWKTLVFNGSVSMAVLLAEILTYLSGLDWHLLLSPQHVPWVILALGLANILLRHVTSGPAGWRRAAS